MASASSVAGEREFWNWFQSVQGKLLLVDDPHHALFQELADRLAAVHEGLVWEVSSAEQRPRELVVSADGIAENVDAVERLCDAAPHIEGWTFVRFRPRAAESVYHGMKLNFNDAVISPNEVEVALYPLQDGRIGVQMFLGEFEDKPPRAFIGAAFILLDVALGEYDAICKVGPFEVVPARQQPIDGFQKIPYVRMRIEFDRLFEELNN